MKRKKMNRQRGAKMFNQRASKTRMVNLAPPPMRGGYRM